MLLPQACCVSQLALCPDAPPPALRCFCCCAGVVLRCDVECDSSSEYQSDPHPLQVRDLLLLRLRDRLWQSEWPTSSRMGEAAAAALSMLRLRVASAAQPTMRVDVMNHGACWRLIQLSSPWCTPALRHARSSTKLPKQCSDKQSGVL